MLMRPVKRAKRRKTASETVAALRKRLRLLEKRNDLVMDAINEGVFDWNVVDGSIVYSTGVQKAVGLPDKLKTIADWRDRIHPEDLPRYLQGIVEHFKGKTERFRCDYRYEAADGSWRWARQHGIALRDRRGRAVRVIGSTGDITELKEAEERQAAITEILAAMSASPTDTGPVFDAIVQSALRLFPDAAVYIRIPHGTEIRLAAIAHRDPGQVARLKKQPPVPLSREYLHGAVLLDRRVVDVADATTHDEASIAAGLRQFRASGYRAVTIMPMLRGDTAIGTIAVARQKPGALAERQVSLLRTFADEAVIAIENVRLFNETKEALERQEALAGVLGTISGSIADTKPVFDKILESCQRLFEGHLVGVTLAGEDGQVHLGAYQGDNREAMERIYPMPLGRESGTGRAILDRNVVHFPDVGAPGSEAPPQVVVGARTVGFKSIVFAPLLAEGRGIGALWVGRRLPGPFSERQIALLKSFADQAVIAILNARQFNETREALERQIATAEILKVISGSPTDTQPVFDAIVQGGLKLFSDAAISIALPDGEMVRAAAVAESDPSRAAAWRSRFPFALSSEYMHGAAILERRVIDIPDVRDAPAGMVKGAANFLASGYRGITIMPLMRGDEAIGALSVVRSVPGPLSDKQKALLKTFADQAVIAIENVRLLNETKEALEQQKASGEVLSAISSSIADTRPVFDKITESCQRLFAGRIVGLNVVGDDGFLHIGSYRGSGRAEFERIFPLAVDGSSGSSLAIVERRVVHYPDAQNGAEVPLKTRQGCAATGVKSVIFAPVLREGRGLGAIFVGRDYVRTFSDKDIGLLRTFADQAAIAIENARLFNEIQEKSRQLEIASRHKSEFLANMSHELRTPLNAIIGFTRIVMRRSREVLETKQYENLEKIHASGQDLLALINAILDLSKIEAGRVELVLAETALAPVLEQCLRTVEPLVKVSLVKEFDGGLPPMYVDEEKLRQVVVNLLSNAAKFTERGNIRLRAEAANGSVAIAVADTGIGIPPDKLDMIFEEFEQVDASSTRAHGGTGLGLAIARRLARLMGGDISVESALGRGSTFTLTLPMRSPA
jgi:signal transduction histidine kinase